MTGDAGVILAIDQGTSATKALAIDAHGAIVAKASSPLATLHPAPGWVEQDADAIWASVQSATNDCLAQLPAMVAVAAIAISNQRESLLMWHCDSGKPVAPMLSWQDGRTTAIVGERHDAETASWVRERSGLPLDPMFSAAKACWLLDQHDAARSGARAGRYVLGTIDAWLLQRLGARAMTEPGNASRTQLLDIRNAAWDADLLALFDVPAAAMPDVVPSIGARGDGAALHPRLAGVAVHAVMGDSHAALFGHGAFDAGDMKATLGTGSSVMALARAPADASSGICTTIAWDLGSRGRPEPQYALEGNIRCAGATVKWLAELFGLSPEEAAREAEAQEASAGVDGLCLVPAFGGLGAPWWDPQAVGIVGGLTLATTRGQLMHAAVDSIAHQITDVVAAMDACLDKSTGCGRSPSPLQVDGGPTRNAHLRGLLAAYIGRPVLHNDDAELSALGAAHAAGLSLGWWTLDALRSMPRQRVESRPQMPAERIAARRAHWADALRRSRLGRAS